MHLWAYDPRSAQDKSTSSVKCTPAQTIYLPSPNIFLHFSLRSFLLYKPKIFIHKIFSSFSSSSKKCIFLFLSSFFFSAFLLLHKKILLYIFSSFYFSVLLSSSRDPYFPSPNIFRLFLLCSSSPPLKNIFLPSALGVVFLSFNLRWAQLYKSSFIVRLPVSKEHVGSPCLKNIWKSSYQVDHLWSDGGKVKNKLRGLPAAWYACRV